MSKSTEPKRRAATAPAVFVHALGSAAVRGDWPSRMQKQGIRLLSHAPLEGAERTAAPLEALGALLCEWAERAPGQPLVLLRAPLQLSRGQLALIDSCLKALDGPHAITALSNADPALNPAAGLRPEPGFEAERLADLVTLLGSERLHERAGFPQHCLALSAAAVRALADPTLTLAAAPARLHAAGGRVFAAERLYVFDPGHAPFAAAHLEPHEQPCPAPWGRLSASLQEWLRAGLVDAGAAALRGDAPLTLHLTHSWGGGVAQWVQSFIAADDGGRHLQLRSEGPQRERGVGQRLSLYAGNQLESALERWWLQPPIDATAAHNEQYRAVLDEVCRRFGVGRIIVSSLVGHSLDALRTGLPTVQVLHDQYPAWPLLDRHPGDYAGELERAWRQHGAAHEFPDTSLAQWLALREQYLVAVRDGGVRLVAPTQAVVSVRRALDPRWANVPIAVIAHGEPPLPGAAPVTPRPRTDGRLRLVIPGRMQAGKGAALLRQALPELTRHAQVYLLGTGQGGEQFFGSPGVHVLTQYRREDLPALLRDIGPHLAALVSVVPETFSYTLSEMQALGVPVVATRVGSFAERIVDGHNGWLVEPTAAALVQRIAVLHANPATLEQVRKTLASREVADPAAMVAAYAALCPPLAMPLPAPSLQTLSLAEAQATSQLDLVTQNAAALETARAAERSMEQEVARRTEWALDLSRDLEHEIRRREEWVGRLSAEIDENRARITGLNNSLEQMHGELGHLRAMHRQLENEHRALEAIHRSVLASSSWRLTRPLRVARRMGGNFMRARAWNPLRWPQLLGQFLRNLATVGPRGTLERMQRGRTAGAVAAAPTPVPAASGRGLPASMPRAATPNVTVVIPVFNHIEVTAACLASVAAARCTMPFEVIVVDDASQDASAQRLATVDGLTVLRNDQNLGFVRSCNRGAAQARGEYLVLLNNDTEVTDGWLDRLLEVFALRPDAGLVGARLVYPDGRLQECGGIVFRDGSGWNYGRGDSPDRPEYQVLREVDYCSGACIALRRDWFNAQGGFDERYAPAYYEDTDLAFRIRAAGLRVYVQPACTVVHHEGVSSGTDEDSGTKRYQAVNRDTFRARWAAVLATHPERIADPNDAAAVRAARDHRLRGRVLLVDAHTPEPDQDSGSVRLVNLMQCLQALGYGVSFLADNRAWCGGYTQALQAAGVEAWYAPWLDSPRAFLEQHGGDFCAVLVSRHYVATHYLAPVRRHCPRARFIFDTVDLHYLREQRLAELEGSAVLQQTARQTRRAELAVIRAADATLVVSTVEREVLARDAPEARVFVLSNIHEVQGRRTPFEQRRDLFFMGGYQHPPNIDAAQWFVREIWPRVHARLPGVTFHLVGSKAPRAVRELDGDGVKFHGFVPDLAPFLDGCRLAVAPLRYGAGVKGKINHSMSHGQPVVATPIAVEGMFAEHGREVLVAATAADFADEVVRLYTDAALWERLSAASIENVEAHFSLAAARRSLEAVLAELGVAG